MPDAGRIIPLRLGHSRARVSTAGAAILGAEVAGRPLLLGVESPGLATRLHGSEACFPLVPFGGRIEANSFTHQGRLYHLARNTQDPLVLHGDGWQSLWSVDHVSDNAAVLSLDHAPSPASPYGYRAQQVVELLPDGLKLTLSVVSRATGVLPYGLGFHPFLPAGPGSLVQFHADTVWDERPGFLPGKPLPLKAPLDFAMPRPLPDIWLNNCFEGWDGHASLEAECGDVITVAADPTLSRMMVYRPSGQADFLCLEPMTHRPNSHSDASGGLVMLAPDEVLSASMTVTLAPL